MSLLVSHFLFLPPIPKKTSKIFFFFIDLEYISTLEGDIAERDRLLAAIRSELGSSQSENVALRQEIAALKRALLAGRGTGEEVMLPPPGPIPSPSPSPISPSPSPMSIPITAPTTATTPSMLLTANTKKDLASKNKAFWGGVGVGGMGGITSVHTVLMPEVNVGLGLSRKPLAGTLMENLNPALNGVSPQQQQQQEKEKKIGGFEGFTDSNMFTLKTLDAYVPFFSVYYFYFYFYGGLRFRWSPSVDTGCSYGGRWQLRTTPINRPNKPPSNNSHKPNNAHRTNTSQVSHPTYDPIISMDQGLGYRGCYLGKRCLPLPHHHLFLLLTLPQLNHSGRYYPIPPTSPSPLPLLPLRIRGLRGLRLM